LQLALEDRGWLSMSITAAQQFSRDGLNRASALCRILAVANPLVKHGLALRHAYVWGQGVEVQGRDDTVNQVVQKFNTDNEASFSGAQAREELERSLGTDGNVFLALFTSPLTGRVKVRSFPFEEIAEVVCNPDDRDEPWYYLRRWTAEEIDSAGRRRSLRSEAYYPALGYRPRARWKMIDDVEVIWDAPIKHVSVNRLDGWDFGVPDVYSSMPWARAFKEFLENWARLVKSLSKYSWRLSGDKSSGAQRAAAQVRTAAAANPDMIGATAVGAAANLEAIPKSGATIDSNSGRPLAAMVAAGLGLPVTMLLADPGQTGARAVAETLDEPTRLIMQGRRDLWASVMRQVYGHVVDQAIKAPRGPLAGTVLRDEYGDEVIALAGDDADGDRTIDITFPSLSKVDPATVIKGIVDADSTDLVPDEVIARLLLMALGVEDIDDALKDYLDEQGRWIDKATTAGDRAARAFRDGDDPADALNR
jgi:hypothetical protein